MAREKKVAWETPEPTEEPVPTTPVPDVDDEGFNVASTD